MVSGGSSRSYLQIRLCEVKDGREGLHPAVVVVDHSSNLSLFDDRKRKFKID